jgi:hypothetical protein
LDTRGNHDSRNVWDAEHSGSFFSNYSVSGVAKRKSPYEHVLKKEFGSYQFIGIDTTLRPGMQRLLSFFARVDHNDLEELEKILENSKDHNLSIAFGHFPLGMVADSFSLKNSLLLYAN